jgi:hypothetical protein
LFNPSGTRVEPLWINPTLAQVGTWLSCGLVVAALAWLTLREDDAEGEDRAFALTVLLAKLPPQSDRRGVVVEKPDSSRATADLVARAALPYSSS